MRLTTSLLQRILPIGLAPGLLAGCSSSHGVGNRSDGELPTSSPDARVSSEAVDAAARVRACDRFLDIWTQAQAERRTFVPGAARNDCDLCVLDAGCTIAVVEDDACSPTDACIERNCICDRAGDPPAIGDCKLRPHPSDLCACIDSCLPTGRGQCAERWDARIACYERACGARCAAIEGSP